MIDEERRYFWAAEWGLTDEDWEIIRTRGIPMLDQERAARYEHEVDARHAIDTMAAIRRVWRYRRNYDRKHVTNVELEECDARLDTVPTDTL